MCGRVLFLYLVVIRHQLAPGTVLSPGGAVVSKTGTVSAFMELAN